MERDRVFLRATLVLGSSRWPQERCSLGAFWVHKSLQFKAGKNFKQCPMSFFFPTKQKRCVEQIWCELVGDLHSGYLPSDLWFFGFFVFRSQNKKSWRMSNGGTWKNFSHSLNCRFSQGIVLETAMINNVQGSADYQVDAGLCFLGMGIVWSRSGVWGAHGMTWTQPNMTSELRPSAGLCVWCSQHPALSYPLL